MRINSVFARKQRLLNFYNTCLSLQNLQYMLKQLTVLKEGSVFVGDKIQREPKVHEIKPPIVNQQRVIYKLISM